jgi:hypothetical protein
MAAAASLVISLLLAKTFLHPLLSKGAKLNQHQCFSFHFILFYFLLLPMLNSSVFFQQILGIILSPTNF